MAKLALFMADGNEEVEALSVIDIVRRGKMEIDIISITGKKNITTSHKVTVEADRLLEEVDVDSYDGIICPGGIPGTPNLCANETVVAAIQKFAAQGKLVAAICAAPSILGFAGVLEGKKATCYPGFEDKLTGAQHVEEPVVVDGNVITAWGLGAAIRFGLAIVSYYDGEEAAKKIQDAIMFC